MPYTQARPFTRGPGGYLPVMGDPDRIVERLHEALGEEDRLANLLERSLVTARKSAESEFALTPVGMAHVSSVMVTAVEGEYMAKGEEFGFFPFGGSDIIVLFQDGVDPQIDTGEQYRLVGTPIARCGGRA